MKKTRLFSLILAAFMLISVIPFTVSAGTFEDVADDAYYAEAVQWAYENGVTTGKTETKFAPDDTCTRGQVVTFLWRSLGKIDLGKSCDFSDVSGDDYFRDPVVWSVFKGITNGTSADKFSPDRECTYAHILTFIYRAAGEPGKTGEGEWYSDALKWAQESGLLEGTYEGELDVNAPCPRANVVTYIYRNYLNTVPEGDYKYVILIGVDGAGNFFREADTPNLDRIFENGAISYDVLTSNPTISAQCWGSMLHGVTPEFHRLTNSIVDAREFNRTSIFPSVFRVIRENMPFASLASFSYWNPINKGIIEEGLGVHKDSAYDREEAVMIADYVKENKPNFVFVQFDTVDGAGHEFGYGTENHLKQITEVDKYIDQIYKAYEEAGIIDDTLFIVSADHGGFEKNHGGDTDTEKYIMVAARGKTVQKGTIGDMEVRDLASVVLHAFGLDDKQPDAWTSRVPSGLFEGYEAGERPVFTVEVLEHRAHESEPTPAIDSENSVLSVLDPEKLLVYLPLDGSEEAAAGQFTTEHGGKLYYVDGYFGQAARFDDGFITVPDYSPMKDDMTFGGWLNLDTIEDNESLIFTNKLYSNSKTRGFAFIIDREEAKFTFKLGDTNYDFIFDRPLDYDAGWMYFVLSIDRENRAAKLSFDFEPFSEVVINGNFIRSNLSYKTFTLGNDSEASREHALPGVVDEFFIYEGVLTDNDIAALKQIYIK